MGWVLIAIFGAGAARAAWMVLKAYERIAAARDELDESLHPAAPDDAEPEPNPAHKPQP